MKTFIIVVTILLLTTVCNAQERPFSTQDSVTVEITLKEGDILRGRIIRQDSSVVVFSSTLTGEISIPREKILAIKTLDPTNQGSQQVYVNLASRYFFSPSAINMKKGDGYYQNIAVTLQSFNYAFSDYFTMGGGFEVFSLLSGHPLIFVTPKVGFELTDNLHVGAGYLYMNVLNTNSSFQGVNVGYGNITLGNEDKNVSINAGTSIDYPGKPLLTVNGFLRTGPKFGLMTENWIIPTNTYYTICTLGFRVIGRKSVFDFGLVTNPDIVTFVIGIPYLSYSLRF